MLHRITRSLKVYGANVNAFSPNARLYLYSIVISGASMGIYRLLFNFFALSLGYDEALLGNLITTSSLTALIAALPMGYLTDILGRKRSLVISSLLVTISLLVMILFPSVVVFIGMNVLLGLAQSLAGVSMGPFLMENSGEKERTYLFSFSSGLQMGSAFIGNWVGGYLPTWMGQFWNTLPTSPSAYAWSLAIVTVGTFISAGPLLLLKSKKQAVDERSIFAPLAYFKGNSSLLGRLILPMLITSIGAGLFMPFMNIFYRQVHHQTDSAIGSMFAIGSLAMGLGLLIAPPLADRFGKIQLVVITQGISIPFLILLGFSPVYGLSALAYYVRLGLMNMTSPVYQTFVLEKVEPSARGTVASLVSMANSFGWAFSPTISGMLQVKYGFSPVFMSTLILYIISVYLYWRYFWKKPQAKTSP